MMLTIKPVGSQKSWLIITFVVLLVLTLSDVSAETAASETKPLKFVWTAASGAVDHYNVYVSTDEADYNLDGITYETTYTISGAHGHSYRMQVQATDAAGQVGPRSEESDRVLCDTCSPVPIIDLAASKPTSDSITLTWTAPGDDGDTGVASAYDMRYSVAEMTAENWNDATPVTDEPAPQAAGTAEELTVMGLLSETTYYFALKAADEVQNWSGLSNVVTIETHLTNVTAMSQLKTSKIKFSKPKHQFNLKVTWENLSAEPFSQPLQVVIDNLTPSAVTVANEDGTTSDGKPYYDFGGLVGDGKLEPGETSAPKGFIFNSPDGQVQVEFDLSCWAKVTRVSASPQVKSLLAEAKRLHLVIPAVSGLAQNFPNPFNPETWIPYQLAEDSEVRISIYNVQGRLVRTLDLGRQERGQYFSANTAAYWDGRNNHGEPASSGIYFYQIQAGDFAAQGKMVVLK